MTAPAKPPTAADVAQLLAELQPRAVARVSQGVSTWVYRVVFAEHVAYLRVLPEVGSSFWPEVATHQLLAADGVRVPQVLRWEHCSPQLGHSTMLTSAIPGASVADQPSSRLRAILEAAGRDLARVHTQPVAGFGWIDRRPTSAGVLRAEHATFAQWVEAEVRNPLAVLRQRGVLRGEDVVLVQSRARELVARTASAPARLAHGDLDLTHIFANGNEYSGLIDFGEIRGTHQLYDLGHFAIEHQALLAYVLVGYASITPLPADIERQIELTALLIAIRRLGRSYARRGVGHEPDMLVLQAGLIGA